MSWWPCSFWNRWADVDASATPTPSSNLFPSPVKGDYHNWKSHPKSSRISAGFQCCTGRCAHQGYRKHVKGSGKISGWSVGDSHSSGYSQLLLLSVCGHHCWNGLSFSKGSVWVCPWGPYASLESAPAPFPVLFPTFLGTFQSLHLALLGLIEKLFFQTL